MKQKDGYTRKEIYALVKKYSKKSVTNKTIRNWFKGMPGMSDSHERPRRLDGYYDVAFTLAKHGVYEFLESGFKAESEILQNFIKKKTGYHFDSYQFRQDFFNGTLSKNPDDYFNK